MVATSTAEMKRIRQELENREQKKARKSRKQLIRKKAQKPEEH